MKNYYRAIAVILAILTLLCAVSCGGGNTPETESSSADGAFNESESPSESLNESLTESLEKDTERVEISEIGDSTDTESEKMSESAETDSSEGENITEVTESDPCESESATESATESESRGTVIEESESMAQVTTRDGLAYVAKGYKSVEDGVFLFDKGLELFFEDELFADPFNRVAFEYFATEPTKIYITYSLEGEEKTDHFYLLPEDGSFRGLIEGYLADKKGVELKKLTVDTCEGGMGGFMLYDLESQLIRLYEDDLCIENERYKIGCRLSWGGAMTYFEDKQDGDDSLGNLVNIHDTGRLIQQSFYGTFTNDEGYVSVPNGNEGAALWPYNPVQGGDRFNQGSDRLIDVEVGEDYIYIVSQSLDWAYNKGLTYTYYENKYILKDDRVVVDNVATDFSGWEHTSGGQEIPAVYIVSYFDTLTYYNGLKPWTYDDEGVIVESELGGWSDAGSFPLYRGNTETWSIWLNTADNFGFGIYCPNIQKHIAIRHSYNGSKDPMNNATSYVAPSCTIVMQSYKSIEYSYILATGDPEDVRRIFTENKDFTDNASLSNDRYDALVSAEKFELEDLDLGDKSNIDAISSPSHSIVSYSEEEKATAILVDKARDPHVTLNFTMNGKNTVDTAKYNAIEIEYMIPVTNSRTSYTVVLYICSDGSTKLSEDNTVSGTFIADGQYHTLTLLVPDAKWRNELTAIRFDYFSLCQKGDVIYLKSFSLKNYPKLQVENDMTVASSDKLFASQRNTNVSFDGTVGAVKLEVADPNDVNVVLSYVDLGVEAIEYSAIEIEYMRPKSGGEYYAAFYYTTGSDSGYSGSRVASGALISDGEWHKLTVSFEGKSGWDGIIKSIRFDYFEGSVSRGDTLYIRSIKLLPSRGFDIALEADENGKIFSSLSQTTAEIDETVGAVRLVASGESDPYVIMDLGEYALSTEEYSKLVVRYRVPLTNSQDKYSVAVYFTTDTSSTYSESKAVYSNFTVDGLYHTLVIDLSQKAEFTGNVVKIRLDYFQSKCAEGDEIYIESISLK